MQAGTTAGPCPPALQLLDVIAQRMAYPAGPCPPPGSPTRSGGAPPTGRLQVPVLIAVLPTDLKGDCTAGTCAHHLVHLRSLHLLRLQTRSIYMSLCLSLPRKVMPFTTSAATFVSTPVPTCRSPLS